MQRPPASAGVHERHLAVAEATRVVLGSCALYTALSVAAPANDLAGDPPKVIKALYQAVSQQGPWCDRNPGSRAECRDFKALLEAGMPLQGGRELPPLSCGLLCETLRCLGWSWRTVQGEELLRLIQDPDQDQVLVLAGLFNFHYVPLGGDVHRQTASAKDRMGSRVLTQVAETQARRRTGTAGFVEPPQVAETQARRRTGTAGFVEPPHKKAKPEKKAQHVCAIVGGRVFDCNFAMGFNVDAKSFRTASDATRDSCAQACMFTCAPEPLSDAGSWTVSSKGQWRLRGLAGANLTSVSRAYALSRVGD